MLKEELLFMIRQLFSFGCVSEKIDRYSHIMVYLRYYIIYRKDAFL